MSFAEMIVPYRDPSFDHYRRTAYDIGEWGLGYMTTSLALGCDCLGEIRYVDAVLTDSLGEPSTIANAICLHEEDNAVLWKHVDSINGRAEVRRARRMVVSIHATVANYEYLVYWRFYQDGNIECEVRATGIMVTTPIARGCADPAHRDPGRPAHLRAVPPAFPGRPAGPGRRRPAEHRAGGRLDGRADRPGEPVRAGRCHRGDADRVGGGVGAGLQLGHPAGLEGDQPEQGQRGRHPGGLQAGARRGLPGR